MGRTFWKVRWSGGMAKEAASVSNINGRRLDTPPQHPLTAGDDSDAAAGDRRGPPEGAGPARASARDDDADL